LTEMRMIGPKKQYQQGECNDHKWDAGSEWQQTGPDL
jgi:hypothetical protein